MKVVIPIYLILTWSKIFFGHFLARTFDFGMAYALILMIWDRDPVERAADGIHNNKDVWPL